MTALASECSIDLHWRRRRLDAERWGNNDLLNCLFRANARPSAALAVPEVCAWTHNHGSWSSGRSGRPQENPRSSQSPDLGKRDVWEPKDGKKKQPNTKLRGKRQPTRGQQMLQTEARFQKSIYCFLFVAWLGLMNLEIYEVLVKKKKMKKESKMDRCIHSSL